jgi:hypothetical protein
VPQRLEPHPLRKRLDRPAQRVQIVDVERRKVGVAAVPEEAV